MELFLEFLMQGLPEWLMETWLSRWIPHIRCHVRQRWLQNLLIGGLIVLFAVAGIAIAFGLVCLIVLAVDRLA